MAPSGRSAAVGTPPRHQQLVWPWRWRFSRFRSRVAALPPLYRAVDASDIAPVPQGEWAKLAGVVEAEPPYEPPLGKPSKFGFAAKQRGEDGRIWVVRSNPANGKKEEWWPCVGFDHRQADLIKVPKAARGVGKVGGRAGGRGGGRGRGRGGGAGTTSAASAALQAAEAAAAAAAAAAEAEAMAAASAAEAARKALALTRKPTSEAGVGQGDKVDVEPDESDDEDELVPLRARQNKSREAAAPPPSWRLGCCGQAGGDVGGQPRIVRSSTTFTRLLRAE